MVGQSTFKQYGDFSTIHEYFNYMIESKDNGQIAQAKEMFSKLSQSQIGEFTQWLEKHESRKEIREWFAKL